MDSTGKNSGDAESARGIVIMGATSGMGREVAKLMARSGWRVGAAGRRKELLESLKEECPEGSIVTQEIDVLASDAAERTADLIAAVGAGVYLHCSGVGWENTELEESRELLTLRTNGEGFVRCVGAAFRYFASDGGGRIAAVSSIAGTRGLGAAPAYSATKRLQNTYIDALDQLSRMRHLGIRFTDIRPGFVDTALIGDGKSYPMVMETEKVARRIVMAVERGQRTVVIDSRYALLTFLWGLIPRPLWVRLRGISV